MKLNYVLVEVDEVVEADVADVDDVAVADVDDVADDSVMERVVEERVIAPDDVALVCPTQASEEEARIL
jgi:hypothetical protein